MVNAWSARFSFDDILGKSSATQEAIAWHGARPRQPILRWWSENREPARAFCSSYTQCESAA